jgi:hypothetical protein
MTLQAILTKRRQLNTLQRYELNQSATRPTPVWPAPMQQFAKGGQ